MICVQLCPAPFGALTVRLADRIYVMEVENMDMQEGPQALNTVSLSWRETLRDFVRLVRRWWTSLDPCWSRRTPTIKVFASVRLLVARLSQRVARFSWNSAECFPAGKAKTCLQAVAKLGLRSLRSLPPSLYNHMHHIQIL